MTKELKRLSLLILTMITAISVSACGNANEEKKTTSTTVTETTAQTTATAGHLMTEEQVNEDFEAFMKIIEENYPFLGVNKRVNGVDFLANKEVYRKRVKDSKTAEELQVNLASVMSELNSGHADLIDSNSWLDRDYFYKNYRDIFNSDYPFAKMYKPWLEMLERPEAIRFYGELPTIADAQDKENKQEEVFYNNVLTTQLCNGDLAYLRIDSFNHFNEDYDQAQIMTFYKANPNAKALVIDIRRNSGGSSEYWNHLIVEPLLKQKTINYHYSFLKSGENNRFFMDALKIDKTVEFGKVSDLSKKDLPKANEEAFEEFDIYIKSKQEFSPKNSVGFKGKVYVLTSPYVYSASEGFSVFCKDSGFATLVGERTGGDGIGNDPMLFCLPNSGILGRYPVYYGMNAQGVLNEEFKTSPDYQVDYKFDSKSETIDLSLDPCIQAVIKLEKL